MIGEDPGVDIITVAGSVKYEDAVKRSSVVEVNGVAIPLVSIDDLIETTRSGGRQDAADIEVLEEVQRIRGIG